MLTILGILGDIWAIVTSAIKSGLDWVKENPKVAALLFLVLFTNFGTYFYTHKWTTEQVKAEYVDILAIKDAKINQFEKDIEQRETKLKEVEASSKSAADTAALLIAGKEAALNTAKNDFQRKLQIEIDKRAKTPNTSIVVVSPQTNSKVVITLDGDEVICSRFHDAFLDSINEEVNIANSTPNLKESTSLAQSPGTTENVTSTIPGTPKDNLDLAKTTDSTVILKPSTTSTNPNPNPKAP